MTTSHSNQNQGMKMGEAIGSLFETLESDEFVVKCSIRNSASSGKKLKMKPINMIDMLNSHVEQLENGMGCFNPSHKAQPLLLTHFSSTSSQGNAAVLAMHFFNCINVGAAATKQSTLFRTLVSCLERGLKTQENKESVEKDQSVDFILKINQCLSNAAHYNTKSEFLESTSKSTSKLHVSVAKVVHNIIGGYLSDKLVQTGEEMRFLSLMSKKELQS